MELQPKHPINGPQKELVKQLMPLLTRCDYRYHLHAAQDNPQFAETNCDEDLQAAISNTSNWAWFRVESQLDKTIWRTVFQKSEVGLYIQHLYTRVPTMLYSGGLQDLVWWQEPFDSQLLHILQEQHPWRL